MSRRVALVVGLFVGAAIGGLAAVMPRPANLDDLASSRIRYPNEEAAAKRACGDRKLMYWWLEDPRKGSAVLHARCHGVVHVKTEVKF